MTDGPQKHIIVIGGGLAGTSAAHSLIKRGYAVTIIEKNDRLGGRIHSQIVDGVAVEMGAGFISNSYSNLLAYLTENGLNTQLRHQRGNSGIFRNGGVRMATLRTLMGSSALSWKAKLQILPLAIKLLSSLPNLDAHAPWKADVYDKRSVAAMFSNNSGIEFMEYVLQPILNGYFYWKPEEVSEAVLLIIGKAALSHGTHRLQCGLQRIPELAAQGSTVLLDHTVKEIHRIGKQYVVTVKHGNKIQEVTSDGIVCATAASAVPHIFPNLTMQQNEFFKSIQYSSTALTASVYSPKTVYDNKSVAFPRKEGIDLAAVTVSSDMGSNSMLSAVKIYASGAIGNECCTLSDKELTTKLTKMTKPIHSVIFNDDSQPLVTHTQRWSEALPVFDVGHFKRLRDFENGKIEDARQPIVFAGDYIGGPFMEGAFTSGRNAADRLIARLGR